MFNFPDHCHGKFILLYAQALHHSLKKVEDEIVLNWRETYWFQTLCSPNIYARK